VETPGNGLIVVDTNIIAYSLIRGEQTEKAEQLLAREPVWAAPAFWRIEFLNILVSYAHFLRMAPHDVRSTWKASFHLPQLREESVDSDEAMELALKHKITGYDALFVSLAKDLNTVCVTQDKALKKAVPHLTVTMDEFLKEK
jgi:predicted nucleic acid-binding protein